MTADKSKNPEYSDPFIEEVRRLKREAFQRSGNDWNRHFERLREIEERYKDRLLPPPTASG